MTEKCTRCGKPATHKLVDDDVCVFSGEKDYHETPLCKSCYLRWTCVQCGVQVKETTTWMNKPIHKTCFAKVQRELNQCPFCGGEKDGGLCAVCQCLDCGELQDECVCPNCEDCGNSVNYCECGED